MCLPPVDDLHSSESYHLQGQDDRCERHQGHWYVKGHRIEGPIGAGFCEFPQQEDHPKDGEPNDPNHPWSFRLECQENEQEHYNTQVQWGRKRGVIVRKSSRAGLPVVKTSVTLGRFSL